MVQYLKLNENLIENDNYFCYRKPVAPLDVSAEMTLTLFLER